MALPLSVVANVVLVIVLVAQWIRYRARVREEKLATFAGCIGAIVGGLGQEQPEDRLDRIALGLSSMRGGMKAEQFRPLLAKASLVRYFGEVSRFLMSAVNTLTFWVLNRVLDSGRRMRSGIISTQQLKIRPVFPTNRVKNLVTNH